MTPRTMSRGVFLGMAALAGLAVLGACGGEGDTSGRSVETGAEQVQNDQRQTVVDDQILTEADAGHLIVTHRYAFELDNPDKNGLEIHLSGDDGSTLRWRFAKKPDDSILEWHKVDGLLAFETDGLIGDPTTAAKVLQFRGNVLDQTSLILELVERDPAKRTGPPVERLEYPFEVTFVKTGRWVDAAGT